MIWDRSKVSDTLVYSLFSTAFTLIFSLISAVFLHVFLYFSLAAGLKEAGGSLTSLLVQPISALLAKTLLSSPSTGQGDSCIPLAMPPNTGKFTKYSMTELLLKPHYRCIKLVMGLAVPRVRSVC